jgi:hypothetical protein
MDDFEPALTPPCRLSPILYGSREEPTNVVLNLPSQAEHQVFELWSGGPTVRDARTMFDVQRSSPWKNIDDAP